jgi:hypothetical protein
MSNKKIQSLLEQGNVSPVKNESDTIKLWESYRQQALLWRAIALLQIPATSLAIILALVLWSTRSIILKVPAKPLPGTYAVQDIPDTEFINFTQDFVNLVASYQQNVARRQYERAVMMVTEPYLTQFKEQMLSFELRAIETTSRTQFFFADPSKTKVSREGRNVLVSFTGDRLKIVAGQELPLVKTKYTVQLSMIPRNPINPYGIAVSGFTAEEPK